MTIQIMHREVCLKHRKNRREISCGCERELAAVFVLFCQYSGAGSADRTPCRSFAAIVQQQDT
jgi:hypothetical protein